MTFGKGVKRKAEEVQEKEEGKIYWGMGDTPPKKARTVNVHGRAATPRGCGKRTTFGRAKRMLCIFFSGRSCWMMSTVERMRCDANTRGF